ncbi:FAS1 domain-containing protein [Dichotomocladium elegans]|nr:FAS1 domain-containing protein [Dichotomocladium elegans]
MFKAIILITVTFFIPTFAYKTIIDVLSDDARFGRLIECLQRTRLVPEVNNLEAGTLFAPDNSAFEQYEGDITREMLLYHLLPVGMSGQDFYHGQLLESLYVRPGMLGPNNPGQRIKITKDGNPNKSRAKAYINGVEIIEQDLVVNNQTYIQVINKVLVPPRTLGEVLMGKADLYPLLERTGIDKVLKKEEPFTVFVSKFDVLSPFNAIERAYLTSKYGIQDLTMFLNYMVVEGANYAGSFPRGKTVCKSLSGESLVVFVNQDNAISVNGVSVTQTDILSANGVIHEIDSSNIPPSLSFNSRKYLHGLNASEFVSLLDRYSLGHYLDEESEKYTFLAPSNQDMNEGAIPDILKRGWLSYHVLTGSLPPDTLVDKSLLRSQFASRRLGGAPQRVPVSVQSEGSSIKSISFSHSRVLDSTVAIKENIIYQISEPLSLPGNFLNTLVVDLELSTFIATLYVSGVADEIKRSDGITLFAPNNQAFHNLGLIAQYLMHSTGKNDLKNVLRYHVARGLLYHEDMRQYVHDIPTLAGSALRVGPGDNNREILVGRPSPTAEQGVVHETDLLVSNGVVHKVDMVQIPDYVRITARDLMAGVEAKTMIEILEKTGLLSELNKTDTVVLVPTDTAFAHVSIEDLLSDPYELERLVKLHIIPMTWQDQWLKGLIGHDNEHSSLLSEKDKVIFREEGDGDMVILVKDRSGGVPARVRGAGRTFDGTHGGVLLIDAVLIPVHRGFFGLPWGWSIFLVVVLSLIGCSILGGCGFIIYKIRTRRRLGYTSIQ